MKESPIVTDQKGIYIHIPFCKQKCTYCDFPSYQGLDEYFDVYAYALREEIKEGIKHFSRPSSFDTIYFGGGTPTLLSIKELDRILETVHQVYAIHKDVEITIEANPGEVTLPYLKDLRQLGFNRISFGVQTFHDGHLQMLHRSHTVNEAKESLLHAHRAGFTNISIDQIYGLPNQTIEDITHNLNEIRTLPINHISIYGLQVEPSTLLYRQVHQNELVLPHEDMSEQMYDYLINGLEEQLFDRYEIASFSKNNTFSRHNVKYWHSQDYIGFGAGAHSFMNGMRYENTPYVVPYIHSIEMGTSPITHKEVIQSPRDYEDFAFLALRTKWGLNGDVFYKKFNHSLSSIYGTVLDSLCERGLLLQDGHTYCLTKEGAKHGNYVFSQFITT